ncbi:MAG: putative transposase [Kribbellaceae bacterium]|jgi:hypothetical protein|nr:putative transposase [Kribbellaceae bacterium]
MAAASPDLPRDMLTTFIQALMSAEADAICGAPYGLPSPERTDSRNGYRQRDFDTRAGTLDVAPADQPGGPECGRWDGGRGARSLHRYAVHHTGTDIAAGYSMWVDAWRRGRIRLTDLELPIRGRAGVLDTGVRR